MSAIVSILVSFILSILFCGLYLRVARRWQILDVPNERSSHQQPTPRGGGLPLMLAFLVGVILVFGVSIFFSLPYGVVLAGTVFMTILGVVDDSWNLSVGMRFLAYGLCSVIVAVVLLQHVLPASPLLKVPLVLCAALSILWALNLFNFMDGTDGLAAAQCFVACCSAALLCWGNGGSSDYSVFCLLLGFSHLGFLVWNWAPAQLFMGDAGSIPTGFTMAAIAILGAVYGYLPFACWLVLLAVFITDASWTLVWRIFSGQKFTEAHRSHGYQRLSRHWGSHRLVVLLLLALNGFWLFPMAWALVLWPQYTIILVILAYLPLLMGMVKIRHLA